MKVKSPDKTRFYRSSQLLAYNSYDININKILNLSKDVTLKSSPDVEYILCLFISKKKRKKMALCHDFFFRPKLTCVIKIQNSNSRLGSDLFVNIKQIH